MTTYNTGNVIGSTAVKDLYDNAQNLDYAVNDRTTRIWKDRLGVDRRTFWGMEQDFQDFLLNSGYQSLGDYAAGITLTARNQFVWKDGELYRIADSVALPYTATGNWAAESSNFVAIGDRVLRQQLADNVDPVNGAALIAGVRRTVDSIASLKSLPKSGSKRVVTSGYYTPGDGGAGAYWYDPDDTVSADNGGTVIVASDGGRWKLAFAGNVSLRQFGAKGNYDGAAGADDTAALQAAIDWLGDLADGGCLLVPPGRYLIGAVTLRPRVRIVGADRYQTVFVPNADNLALLSLSNDTPTAANVHLESLGFKCYSKTGTTAISYTLCHKTSGRQLYFEGCASNLYIDRGYFHEYEQIMADGNNSNPAGNITFTSTDGSDYCFFPTLRDYSVYNFAGLGASGPGIYCRRCAGALIDRFVPEAMYSAGGTSHNTGILVTGDNQGGKITNSIIAAPDYGIHFKKEAGDTLGPNYWVVENTDVDQPTITGISIDPGCLGIQINGGNITAGSATNINGVTVQGGSNLKVSDVMISGFNGADASGITMANCDRVRISENTFLNCNHGIGVGTAVTYVRASGNDFSSTNGPIAGTPGQTGNDFSDNKYKSGVSAGMPAVATPSVPASGGNVTNVTGYKCQIYISGSGVTGWTKNGAAVGGMNGFNVILNPGERIGLTYSSAPTWQWLPLA